MAFEKDYVTFAGVPWSGANGRVFIDVEGEDLSGATFAWKFYTPATLATVITLANAAAGAQGVSATYDAGAINEAGAIVGATRILPQIDEVTLEALTFDGVNDSVLGHMLYVTPVGAPQYVECFGTFTVKQGAAD